MAYDQFLAERIEVILIKKKVPFDVKKMMGGLCYLVDDKMCFGIVRNTLMAHIHPDIYEESLSKN